MQLKLLRERDSFGPRKKWSKKLSVLHKPQVGCGHTEPIEIGDKYIIFFFWGIADVQTCDSETVKEEINKNSRVHDHTKIDLVTGFWRNCYKIKSTNFDLSLVD